MRSSRLGTFLSGVAALCAGPAAALGPGDIALQRVYTAIDFDAPLAIATAPGDAGHVYVALQDGRILQVPRDPGATTAATFLDIRDRVSQSGGETGLLGLAFDPDYAANGRFFVDYTAPSPLRTVVSRFTRAAGQAAADPASETLLLSFAQPYANHNGGWIGIGPDRHLYIASGDGGSGGDPQNNAQRLDTPLGKVLRIRRDGAIPADNPFVATVGARGEIWAYGMRNPFRMSFDAVTGRLWAGDVGQNAWEEIDLIERGGNYGWRVYEGNHSYNNPTGLPASAFIAPLHEYPHADGCSVIGGVVYRGSAIPVLAGRYVYTDYCSGTLWALAESDGTVQSNVVIGQISGNPSSIGEDQDGELFVTTTGGAIHRIAPGDGSADPAFPQLLSQTGLFADTANLEPAADLVGYELNAPFWSDGARKRRWFRLPAGGSIRFEPLAAWRLPKGSATVKHFDITLADGSERRLETRVFLRGNAGWRGASYRWNEAQTDATLVTSSQTETLQLRTAGGALREQLWEYPSQSACLRCHTAAAGVVLGLTTPQLNRAVGESGANQLAQFAQAGLFATDIGDPLQYARLTDPADATAPLRRRARAWLHANCAQCHRPGGPTGVDMDLRWTVPTAQTHTRGVEPSGDTLGIDGVLRISPGSAAQSLLWQRMRLLDANRMPPLGSHAVDPLGVRVVGDWIRAGAR